MFASYLSDCCQVDGQCSLLRFFLFPLADCRTGKDVSIENLHLGLTHVFESTFENLEGVAEYISHPAHVEFANEFLTALDKVLVIEYKPTTVNF
ncbi:hypothetical protein IFM89_018670 [Coptis chinensis]|uniref:Stress-response A/B barrel domain-containing protein n=1 Tax=Coptis chinensis TaxID=261450 RepID=A0A835I3C8_9MAGN|nr:hypothetical protein IFM89_018670 [Coptis chinensis]